MTEERDGGGKTGLSIQSMNKIHKIDYKYVKNDEHSARQTSKYKCVIKD